MLFFPQIWCQVGRERASEPTFSEVLILKKQVSSSGCKNLTPFYLRDLIEPQICTY